MALLKQTCKNFSRNYIPVTESGCWLWTGTTGRRGYGRLQINGKRIQAHRISWIIKNGPIADNLYILHRCDVSCCVNPDHLFIGTHAENMKDRQRKNRQAKGCVNASAKLTADDIVGIKKLSASLSQSSIASIYNVSDSQISRILNNENWGHVA